MNTDVKALNHGSVNALPRALFRPISFDLVLPESRVMLLLLVILLSLLGIIYIKDLNRRLFIDYQGLQTKNITLHSFQNKLILEESALESPARIQQIAQNLGVPS